MLIGYQLGLVWLQVKVKLNLRKVGFIGSYNWQFTCPAREGLPAVSSGSESPALSFSLLPVAFFRACVWWQNGWLQSSTHLLLSSGRGEGRKKRVSLPFWIVPSTQGCSSELCLGHGHPNHWGPASLTPRLGQPETHVVWPGGNGAVDSTRGRGGGQHRS